MPLSPTRKVSYKLFKISIQKHYSFLWSLGLHLFVCTTICSCTPVLNLLLHTFVVVMLTGNHWKRTFIALVFLGVSRQHFLGVMTCWNNADTAKSNDDVNEPNTNVPLVKVKYEIGWWTPFLEQTARTFQPWKGPKYGWCQPSYDNVMQSLFVPPEGVAPKGLQFIKTPKASSSTCAGVNLAVSQHVARRLENIDNQGNLQCEHYEHHQFAHSLAYRIRNTSESLLWSVIRNPRSRDISNVYFFQVSRAGMDPNDRKALIASLAAERSRQTHYLTAKYKRKIDLPELVPKAIQDHPERVAEFIRDHIIEKYDFIGVTECITESLAVMTLLWDLYPTDVIVLSSKVSGKEGYALTAWQNCSKLQTALDLHPRVKQFMNSSKYMDQNADFLLYYAVNLSLDRTIRSLGSLRVQERATQLRQLQQLADDRCRDKTLFPCSADGTYNANTTCYFDDSGCGQECVNQVMEEYVGD